MIIILNPRELEDMDSVPLSVLHRYRNTSATSVTLLLLGNGLHSLSLCECPNSELDCLIVFGEHDGKTTIRSFEEGDDALYRNNVWTIQTVQGAKLELSKNGESNTWLWLQPKDLGHLRTL